MSAAGGGEQRTAGGTPPRFLFRADASAAIGSGHLMRCLTLARALRRDGAEVAFVGRDAPGSLLDRVAAEGFALHPLSGPFDREADAAATARIAALTAPDWLVVDHYQLDEAWERRLRPHVGRLAAIDDNPGRRHLCDLLLDPNWSEAGAERWSGFVPPGCRLLSGPRFALLREEFLKAREGLRSRDGSVRRVLVSFGGSDAEGGALLALAALARLKAAGRLDGVVVDLVAGAANPHAEALRAAVARLPGGLFTLSADDMALRMAEADLALGAGGGTTWERCFLGLPAIVMVIAGNQREAAAAVDRAGAQWSAGPLAGLDEERLAREIARRVGDAEGLRRAGARAMALMGECDFIRHPLEWLR